MYYDLFRYFRVYGDGLRDTDYYKHTVHSAKYLNHLKRLGIPFMYRHISDPFTFEVFLALPRTVSIDTLLDTLPDLSIDSPKYQSPFLDDLPIFFASVHFNNENWVINNDFDIFMERVIARYVC